MIRLLNLLAFLLEWSYAAVFLSLLHAFLPLYRNWLVRILALFVSGIASNMIIYSNDLPNLLGALFLLSVYIAVFHRGRLTEKITVILVFYPTLIAVNYMMMDVGKRCFFGAVNAPGDRADWTQAILLTEIAVYSAFLLLRLLFWIFAWWFLRKYLRQITSNLTSKMWLILDSLVLASFVAIFTTLCFMPEDPIIVYPICGTSVFSCFGCIYLASYICNSVRTACHAQELEQKQAYYKDRMRDEERIRSIYHDLKNHLLILQAQTESGQAMQASIRDLQEQVQAYELYHHTGSEFLDVIIRDKAKTAMEKQIDFSAVISMEDGGFIEPLDLSSIFGNALDNAIEASERLPEDQRLITVKANRVRDMLVITVENHMDPNLQTSAGTSKADRLLHGFGIPNIQKTVEKYDGQCRINAQDGLFTLKMVIPIP